METIHATAVSIGGAGVLLRGPSGSGKSDLALRLIDGGGRLIADDRTVVSRDGDRLLAAAPPRIAGRMEVRGVGIVKMAAAETAPLRLVADLIACQDVERLPKPESAMILGVEVPLLRLFAFEASAPAKVRLFLQRAPEEIER